MVGVRAMVAHDHTEHVPGCFRCDLSREETGGSDADRLRAAAERLRAAATHPLRGVTAMSRGSANYVTGLVLGACVGVLAAELSWWFLVGAGAAIALAVAAEVLPHRRRRERVTRTSPSPRSRRRR